eukprot:CAMPEP_0201485942 /NCGR_PEP_ID=MMETSP0151_2-20130828/10014_1 /ASSEMBLY_ACC=CAM_ASM_000257 /TAXON_ID=200890 /ORGANISM="Paramoeba atlantica, Strain 621/1 / CCAP 1560/9" /LENGTH=345 /DNA_ID=CAMNT_0047870293 /DNA_START=67 /DNA_END=1104 /DNA_ORIENTATION=-
MLSSSFWVLLLVLFGRVALEKRNIFGDTEDTNPTDDEDTDETDETDDTDDDDDDDDDDDTGDDNNVTFVPEWKKCKTDYSVGPIQIVMNGKKEDHYLAISQGMNHEHVATSSNDKRAITITHGTRAVFVKSCIRQFSQNIFTRFYLLGKTIKFTVDLSHIGCGCNVAIYLVSMPGCSAAWAGDYYCDANGVTGQWCPEIDLMEANNAVLVSTPHKCSYKNTDKCSWNGCDQTGQQFHFIQEWRKIDRKYPFDVAQTFTTDRKGYLTSMTTTLSQGKIQVSHTNSDSVYLKELTQPLQEGMVLVASYWGGGGWEMQWLDVPPCDPGIGCDGSMPAKISNIKVYGKK